MAFALKSTMKHKNRPKSLALLTAVCILKLKEYVMAKVYVYQVLKEIKAGGLHDKFNCFGICAEILSTTGSECVILMRDEHGEKRTHLRFPQIQEHLKLGDIIRIHRAICWLDNGTPAVMANPKNAGCHIVVWPPRSANMEVKFSSSAAFTLEQITLDRITQLRSFYEAGMSLEGNTYQQLDQQRQEVQLSELQNWKPRTYVNIVVQVIGVFLTARERWILRCWDGGPLFTEMVRQVGPQNLTIGLVPDNHIVDWMIRPDDNIRAAALPCVDISVFGEHQKKLETLKSGDYLLIINADYAYSFHGECYLSVKEQRKCGRGIVVISADHRYAVNVARRCTDKIEEYIQKQNIATVNSQPRQENEEAEQNIPTQSSDFPISSNSLPLELAQLPTPVSDVVTLQPEQSNEEREEIDVDSSHSQSQSTNVTIIERVVVSGDIPVTEEATLPEADTDRNQIENQNPVPPSSELSTEGDGRAADIGLNTDPRNRLMMETSDDEEEETEELDPDAESHRSLQEKINRSQENVFTVNGGILADRLISVICKYRSKQWLESIGNKSLIPSWDEVARAVVNTPKDTVVWMTTFIRPSLDIMTLPNWKHQAITWALKCPQCFTYIRVKRTQRPVYCNSCFQSVKELIPCDTTYRVTLPFGFKDEAGNFRYLFLRMDQQTLARCDPTNGFASPSSVETLNTMDEGSWETERREILVWITETVSRFSFLPNKCVIRAHPIDDFQLPTAILDVIDWRIRIIRDEEGADSNR